MIVIGLILVVLAVLLGAGVAASSGNRATLDVFGVGFDTHASVVFFIGVVTAAALLLGLWLTKAGLARGYRRRKEVRALRHKAKVAPAPVADMSSARSDRADEDKTREVAAGNDAGSAYGPGDDEGPRHRVSATERTPSDKPDDGPTPIGDAGSTSAGKSGDATTADQKDDGIRTAPRFWRD